VYKHFAETGDDVQRQKATEALSYIDDLEKTHFQYEDRINVGDIVVARANQRFVNEKATEAATTHDQSKADVTAFIEKGLLDETLSLSTKPTKSREGYTLTYDPDNLEQSPEADTKAKKAKYQKFYNAIKDEPVVKALDNTKSQLDRINGIKKKTDEIFKKETSIQRDRELRKKREKQKVEAERTEQKHIAGQKRDQNRAARKTAKALTAADERAEEAAKRAVEDRQTEANTTDLKDLGVPTEEKQKGKKPAPPEPVDTSTASISEDAEGDKQGVYGDKKNRRAREDHRKTANVSLDSENKEKTQETTWDKKVVTAHDKLAYNSREYTTEEDGSISGDVNDFLDPGVNDKILKPGYLKVGDKVTLRVVGDDWSYVDSDGGTRTKATEILPDQTPVPNWNVPIEVIFNGERIAYLHVVNWINKSHVRGEDEDIEQQKEFLKKIREKVVSTGEQGLEVTITERGYGKLIKAADKSDADVAAAFPDNPSFVFSKDDGTSFYKDQNNIDDDKFANKEGYEAGIVSLKLKVSEDKYLAIPVNKKKVGEADDVYVNTIVGSIEAHINGDTTIRESGKALSTKELRNIVENLVMSHHAGSARNEHTTFRGVLLGAESTTRLLSVENNGEIEFGVGNGRVHYRAIKSGDKWMFTQILGDGTAKESNQKDFIEELKNTVPEMYFNVIAEQANKSEEITMSLSRDGKLVDEQVNYGNFARTITTTDLRSMQLKDGTYIHTIQPIIRFNAGSVLGQVRKEEGIQDLVDPQRIAGKEKSIHVTKGGEVIDFSDQPDEADFPGRTPEWSNNLTIQDLGLTKQISVVRIIVNRALAATAEEGRVSFNEQAEKVKQDLIEAREQVRERGMKDLEKEYNLVIDKHWDELKRISSEALDRITILKTEAIEDNVEEGDAESGLEDAQSDMEKANYNDDKWLTMNLKASASRELKSVLTGIRNRRKDGSISVNYLRLQEYLPPDTIYNTLSSHLQGYPPDYQQMMDGLEEEVRRDVAGQHVTLIDSQPWLRDVILKLDTAPEHIRNEFVSLMSKHYVDMRMTMWAKRNDGGYDLIVRDINDNAIAETVRSEWELTAQWSPLFRAGQDEKYYINEETAEAWLDQYKQYRDRTLDQWKEAMDNKIQRSEFKEWLSEAGIALSDETIDHIVDRTLRYSGQKWTMVKLFKTRGGVFNELAAKISGRKTEDIDQSRVFKENSIRALARQEAMYTKLGLSNSHYSAGKIIYSYTANKFMIERLRKLKQDPIMVERLRKLPFSKDSRWLKWLTEESQEGVDSYFRDNFEYFYMSLEALKELHSTRIARHLKNSPESDHEIAKMGLFFHRGTSKEIGRGQSKVIKRLAYYLYPTNSDKSNPIGLKAEAVNIDMDENSIGDATVQMLFDNLFLPELRRMAHNKQTNIQGYDSPILNSRGDQIGSKTAKDIFYFIPELNQVEELFLEDGRINDAESILNNDAIVEKVKETIKTTANKLVQNKLDSWADIGITEKNNNFIDKTYFNKIADNNLRFAAADMTVNYLLANANMHQLFIGDPALYYDNKNGKLKSDDMTDHIRFASENLGKRLAADIAPGNDIAGSADDTFNLAVVQDWTVGTVDPEYYERLGLSDKWKKFDSTDAQEFITLTEHANILFGTGKITREQRDHLIEVDQDPESERKIDRSIIPDIYGALKPVYVQNVKDSSGIERRVYIKSSSFPLAPELTEGLKIDKLREAMKNKGIDRVAFTTAVKVGGPAKAPAIFNADGTIVDNVEDILSATPLSNMPREGMRMQQELPYREGKTEINDGTQQRKLLFSNILEEPGMRELYDRYIKLYDNLFKERADAVEKEFRDDESFRKIMEKEARARGYTPNDITALTELFQDGKFQMPLWAMHSSTKLESLLLSVFDNRVRRNKMTGDSLVLVSEAGWTGESPRGRGIKFTKDWKGRLGRNEIIVPWKYKNLNFNDIDSLPEEALKVFGYRIPTQGHNSMADLKIVGFLPPGTQDVVIATRDLVNQMGSDFDVDKLNIHKYNLVRDPDGKPRVAREGDESMDVIENEILDIHFKVFENEKVKTRSATPLNEGNLQALADRVAESYKGENIPYILSDEYQKRKYINATAGKSGIGVFSSTSMFHTLIQDKSKKIQLEHNGRIITTAFGEESSRGALSRTDTLDGEASIGDIVSAFQSASVDNERLQILEKVNVNSETFKVIKSLMLMGFSEKTIVGFINQPIIRDYVREVQILRSNTREYTANAEQIARRNMKKKYELEGTANFSKATLSGEQMMELIEKKDQYPDFKAIQYAMLMRFAVLDSMGTTIQTAESAVNIDSAGLGKNWILFTSRMDAIRKLDGTYSMADHLFGLRNSPNVMPNSISGTVRTRAGWLAGNRLNNFFGPLNNSRITEMTDKILEEEGQGQMTVQETARERNRIIGHIKSYSYTAVDEFATTREERNNIFYDKRNADGLFTNMAIGTVVSFVKNTPFGRRNPFIRELTVSGDGRVNPKVIRYNATRGQDLESLIPYQGFEDMMASEEVIGEWNGKKYTGKMLAEELIKYSYLTGGIQEAIQFTQFIPVKYLVQIGMPSDMMDTWRDIDREHFTEQYFRNNPHRARSLRVDLSQIEGGKKGIKKGVFSLKRREGTNKTDDRVREDLYIGDNGRPPEYLSYRDPKGPTRLFKKTDDKLVDTYEEIQPRKSRLIREYYANEASNMTTPPVNKEENEPVNNNPDLYKDDLPRKYAITQQVDNRHPKERIAGVLETISRNTTDKYFRAYADLLREYIDNVAVDIHTDYNLNARGRATYSKDQITISINPRHIEGSSMMETTILHELTHAMTRKILNNPTTDNQQRLKQRMVDLHAQVEKAMRKKYGKQIEALEKRGWKNFESDLEERVLYGVKNVDEFVTMAMTSKEFQAELRSTEITKDRSLWDKFIELVSKFLRDAGIKIDDNAMEILGTVIASYEATKDAKQNFMDQLLRGEIGLEPGAEFAKRKSQEEKAREQLEKEKQGRLIRLKRLEAEARSKKDIGRREELAEKINKLEQEVEEIRATDALEDLVKFGDADLSAVEDSFLHPMDRNDILEARKTIQLWIRARSIFLTDAEIRGEGPIVQEFNRLKTRAEALDDRIHKIELEEQRRFVSEQEGRDVTTEEAVGLGIDIGPTRAAVVDIGRTGRMLFESVYRAVKAARDLAIREGTEVVKEIESKLGGLSPDQFFQTYNNGDPTGNLVHRYSAEFFDTKGDLRRAAIIAKPDDKRKAWTRYFQWIQQNEINMDVRKLFPDPEQEGKKFPAAEIAKHKKMLKDHLGDIGYSELTKRMEDRMADYKAAYEWAKDKFELGDPNNATELLEEWKKRNSPYIWAKHIEDGKPIYHKDNIVNFKGYDYVESVPRRFYQDQSGKRGKDTPWYDSRFAEIEKDSKKWEAYKFMVNTLRTMKNYLPPDKVEGMSPTSIPDLDKTVIEQYSEGNMKRVFAGVYDSLKRNLIRGDISSEKAVSLDPLLPRERDLSVSLFNQDNLQVRINQKIQAIRITKGLTSGERIPPDEYRRAVHEAKVEQAQSKSKDLVNIMKAMSMVAISYKHKAAVEGNVKLAKVILERAQEPITNPRTGEVEREGEEALTKESSKSFQNLKNMFDYYMDVFFGEPRKAGKEVKFGKKKIKTAKDKQRETHLKRLMEVNQGKFERGEITQSIYNRNATELQKEISSLGGHIRANRLFDNILRWVQLKGMGWNIFSGIANLGFGMIANVTEAASAEFYNTKQMWDGYSMVLSSVFKNAGIDNDIARKIRSLMDKLDVLRDASIELYQDNTLMKMAPGVKRLMPYQIQKHTEYINQASIMVAMMLNQGIWNKFDNDGNWIGEKGEGWSGKEGDAAALNKWKLKLEKIIHRNHGNYDPDSPILLKKEVWGRALSQFRTWALEGFTNRFEDSYYDNILETQRKGRYRSLAFGEQSLTSRLGYGGGLLEIGHQLLRKLALQRYNVDRLIEGGEESRFTKADALNMQRNITELITYMSMIGMGLMLKLALGDGDDEEDYAIRFTLNMLMRVQTDIEFYISPTSFEALARATMPAASLLTDSKQWLDASIRLLKGDDKINTGIYSGKSRWWRETSQMLPFGTQVYRFYSSTHDVFDD
jgi:hypothetical protein